MIWWSVTPELKNRGVIRIAVINRRLSSHEMCHPEGSSQRVVSSGTVITFGVIATALRHPSKKVITSGVIATPLRHHKVLCKEKVPDRCRGLSPKP